MGSKKPTFSCLAKAPLYQTSYSNFATSFFNIFYYFIYIYLFIFFTTPKIPSFLIFLFPLSLSLLLFPLFSPHLFFFRLPLLCSRPWCILPPPSFFWYPFSSVSRSVRTRYRRPARTHTHRFKSQQIKIKLKQNTSRMATGAAGLPFPVSTGIFGTNSSFRNEGDSLQEREKNLFYSPKDEQ